MLFKRQVDDFAVAAPSKRIADILFDMIDDRLTFPLKCMGIVELFNGTGVLQTQDYIKVHCKTYLERIMQKHLDNWMQTHNMPDRPTPLPTKQGFMESFLSAVGDGDPKVQADLAKEMKFTYRSGIGEIIYAMIKC